MNTHDTRVIGDYLVTTVQTAPPYFENCYVVYHKPSNKQVIVDPGSGARPILEQAEANKGSVAAVLLTHGHPDHIASLADVCDAMKVPVYAHRAESVVIDAAPEWGKALLGQTIRLPEEITYFEEEQVLDLLGGIRVVATPGHTPGGVCYVFDGFALTGDTLFMHGVGRTDFPGGDSAQLAASIGRFLKSLPGETLLMSGHGPAWKAEDARSWWKNMGPMMV